MLITERMLETCVENQVSFVHVLWSKMEKEGEEHNFTIATVEIIERSIIDVDGEMHYNVKLTTGRKRDDGYLRYLTPVHTFLLSRGCLSRMNVQYVCC